VSKALKQLHYPLDVMLTCLRWYAIPTKLSNAQFEEFVLLHLSHGRRGPPPTLSLQDLQLHPAGALDEMSVEDAADRHECKKSA
jgi:hypothetical protein